MHTAESIREEFLSAVAIGDEVEAMVAAHSYFTMTGVRLTDPDSPWFVQFSEGGNALDAEFTGDGTVSFPTREKADAFVASFTGAWVGEPHQRPHRMTLKG